MGLMRPPELRDHPRVHRRDNEPVAMGLMPGTTRCLRGTTAGRDNEPVAMGLMQRGGENSHQSPIESRQRTRRDGIDAPLRPDIEKPPGESRQRTRRDGIDAQRVRSSVA